MSRLYKHLQDTRDLPKANMDHTYEYIPLKTSNARNWKILSFLGGLLTSICVTFVTCYFIFGKKAFISPKGKMDPMPIESVISQEDESDYFVFVDPYESEKERSQISQQQATDLSLACHLEENHESLSAKEDISTPPTNLISKTQAFPSVLKETKITSSAKKAEIAPWNLYWGERLKDIVYALCFYYLEGQQTIITYLSHSLVSINALANTIKGKGDVKDSFAGNRPNLWNLYWAKTFKNIVSNLSTYVQSKQLIVNTYLFNSIIAMDELAQNTARRLKLKDFYKQGTWVSFNLPISKSLNTLSQSLSSQCNEYFEKISKVVGLAQESALFKKLNANQYIAENVKKEFEVHQIVQPNPVIKKNKTDKHLAAVYKVLRKLKIYSISIDGDDTKVNLNGNIYYPHTFVSQSPKLKFVGIEKNKLIFRDEYNKKFHKRISNE